MAERATVAPRRQVEVGTEVPMCPRERGRGEITVGYTVGWRVGLSLHIPTSSAPRPHPFRSHSPLERMDATPEFTQSKLGPQAASDFISSKSRDRKAGVRTRDMGCH